MKKSKYVNVILLRTGACSYDLRIWHEEDTNVITNADPETIAQALLENNLSPAQVAGMTKKIEQEYQQLKHSLCQSRS